MTNNSTNNANKKPRKPINQQVNLNNQLKMLPVYRIIREQPDRYKESSRVIKIETTPERQTEQSELMPDQI